MANLIRQRGNEYGSVTKRPRRCGWFDAVSTRYAAELNGFDSVALTKLDVLDALEEIKVCVGYEINGERVDTFPAVAQDLASIKPIYETLEGLEGRYARHDKFRGPAGEGAGICAVSVGLDRRRDRAYLNRAGARSDRHPAGIGDGGVV